MVGMARDGVVPTDELPFGGTLRLVMGGVTRSGWKECRTDMLNVATDRHPATDPCALSWRGRVVRGHKDVTNVCRNLAGRFLGLGTLAQDLSIGSRGPDVEHAERWLRRHGFDPGPTDGVFDQRTRQAVAAGCRDPGR